MASAGSSEPEKMDVDPQPDVEKEAPTENKADTKSRESSKKMVKPGKRYEIVKTDKLHSKVDLEALIANLVGEVAMTSVKDEARMTKCMNRVKNVEKKSKDLLKITDDCKEKLSRFKADLEKEEEEENAKHMLAEESAKDATMNKERQIIDVDSDDDIKIIGSSFDPNFHGAVGVKDPILMKLTTSAGPQKVAVSNLSQQPPTMDALRAALSQAIQKQLPPGQTYSVKIAEGRMHVQSNQRTMQFPSSQTFMPLIGQPAVAQLGSGQEIACQTPAEESQSQQWETLTVGSKVFAQKPNEVWYPATVTEITGKGNEKNFRVKFDSKGTKLLGSRFVAYRDSIRQQGRVVKVGTRVVANYREDEVESKGGNSFYAGIVAEAPSMKNQKRYLIFFDDGYAQYSPDTEIHKVYVQSDNVWEDIHPDSQEFIKEYLKQYPERPMVRLMRGQIVKTEWNGKWWSAKVMEVDASLVKMYFNADKRTELIYRGSTRLEPLYKALSNAEKIKAAGTGKQQQQVRRLLEKSSRTAVVEYTRGATEEDMNRFTGLLPSAPHVPPAEKRKQRAKRGEGQAAKIKNRAVAKKSTGGSRIQEADSKPSQNWVAPWKKLVRNKPAPAPGSADSRKEKYQASSISSNLVGRDMASVLQERLATTTDMMDIGDEEALGERMDTVLDIKDKPRKQMIPHSCNPQCLRDMEEDPWKCKERNPLLIPLHCGWERHVCKHKPNGKKTIMYRAPCARRLRTMEEIDQYLETTDSKLTIDLFCTDPELQVHSEFVSVKTFCDIKDLSYGKENVPISCINAIDRQYPDYVEYSNQRMPAKGVNIDTDPEFMSFCDCTDNCGDKSKCSCQQLTIQQTTALGERNDSAGYEFRLLKDPILTGIYECNPRCKCNQRCHNRVAQNGLRLRLQVFKTEKRGWGLRCLDDIPQGGFICIYAGQLLTEKGANEDGKQYGDEYLAELDYMEVVEKNKEGYESDVVDPDDENRSEDEDEEDDDEDEDVSGDDISTPSSDSSYHVGGRMVSTGEKKVHVTRKQTRKDSDDVAKSAEAADSGSQKLPVLEAASGAADWSVQKKTQEWVEKINEPIVVDDDEEDREGEEDKKSATGKGVKAEEIKMELDDDELPDLDPVPQVEAQTSMKTGDTQDNESEEEEEKSKKALAKKSTGGSRFKNLPNPKLQAVEPEEKKRKIMIPTRTFFENEQNIYIMDAKSMGNIGRYLNHSCSPNVFVQNVFVDTHDLRFPWVAFFASKYIQAGKELTWDYNYEVGSVSGKVLYCYCGSPQCRGRLL